MDALWEAAEDIITRHNINDPNNAIFNAILEALRIAEENGRIEAINAAAATFDEVARIGQKISEDVTAEERAIYDNVRRHVRVSQCGDLRVIAKALRAMATGAEGGQ